MRPGFKQQNRPFFFFFFFFDRRSNGPVSPKTTSSNTPHGYTATLTAFHIASLNSHPKSKVTDDFNLSLQSHNSALTQNHASLTCMQGHVHPSWGGEQNCLSQAELMPTAKGTVWHAAYVPILHLLTFRWHQWAFWQKCLEAQQLWDQFNKLAGQPEWRK